MKKEKGKKEKVTILT